MSSHELLACASWNVL